MPRRTCSRRSCSSCGCAPRGAAWAGNGAGGRTRRLPRLGGSPSDRRGRLGAAPGGGKMAAMRRRLELESGLVGKLILAWLLVAALLVVLALDVGSILLARYRAAAGA